MFLVINPGNVRNKDTVVSKWLQTTDKKQENNKVKYTSR